MFDKPVTFEEKPEPTRILLVGERFHGSYMDKLLALEAQGLITIVYQSLEMGVTKETLSPWWDEVSQFPDTYSICSVPQLRVTKGRKPKPYYRKGERY